MPYLMTHTAFGDDATRTLPIPQDQLSLFRLGCVGPDIFFYDALPPTPFVRNRKPLGNRMHDTDAGVLFAAFYRQADSTLAPFLYGMLCHLALDSAVHPYIESQAQGLEHTRFEIAIDMLRNPASSRGFGKPAEAQRDVDVAAIDSMMDRVSRELYAEPASGAYRRCYRKFLRMNRLIYDPSGAKRRFLAAVERPFGKQNVLSGFMLTENIANPNDAQNSAHRVWAAPWAQDIARNESFEELYQAGVACAKTWLGVCVKDGIASLLPRLGGYTMSKGAPV